MVYKTIPASYASPVASIAENLRRLRKEGGLTQEQVAAASKLKQAAISKYESGTTTPDVKSLLRLAIGLRRSVEDIVSGVNGEYDTIAPAPAATETTTTLTPHADQNVLKEQFREVTLRLVELVGGEHAADILAVALDLGDGDQAAAIEMMKAWRGTAPVAGDDPARLADARAVPRRRVGGRGTPGS